MVACKHTLLAGHYFVDLNNDTKVQQNPTFYYEPTISVTKILSYLFFYFILFVELFDKLILTEKS